MLNDERIKELSDQAQSILDGDSDNYDGVDAARIIKELCCDLLAWIEDNNKYNR